MATIDWKMAYLGIIKGLALYYRLSGHADRAAAIDKIVEGIQSNRNVDAHMRAVALAVASDTPNDWNGVIARINKHGDEFQGDGGG